MRAGVATLKFPVGGLYRRLSFQRQPPYTTPDCMNVLPDDPITGRERGGQRPALARKFSDGAGNPVRALNTVRYFDDGILRTRLVAIAGGELWRTVNGDLEKLTTNLSFNSAVQLQTAEINGRLYIADYEAAPIAAGSDGVFSNTDEFTSATAGNFGSKGVNEYDYVLQVKSEPAAFLSDDDGVIGGTLNDEFTSATIGDWETANVDPAKHDLVITSPAHLAGTYEIMSVSTTTMVLWIPFNGPATDVVFEIRWKPIVGVYELDDVDGTKLVTVDPFPAVTAIDFEVWRSPKVYDPATDELMLWVAASGLGAVPLGCDVIANWRGRAVLSRGHAWYMSRPLDPFDWDYYPIEPNDPARAVAGAASLAGIPGEPIRALIPHSDDCLVIGCTNSLWIMRGDPAYGGLLDNLSYEAGILGPSAWCYTPEGYLFFLSSDGVYQMAPGCGSTPRSISREMLPEELLGINPASVAASMAYDMRLRLVLLTLTMGAGPTTHWFLDTKTTIGGDSGANASFWPATFPAGMEPFCLHGERSAVSQHSTTLFGCRDGFLRHLRTDKNRDDQGETQVIGDVPVDISHAIASHVVYGPMTIGGGEGYMAGSVHELIGEVGLTSGGVDWSLHMGDNAEDAFSAAAAASGSWPAGVSTSDYPRVRGSAFCLRLAGQGLRWAVENIHVGIQQAGRRRRLG